MEEAASSLFLDQTEARRAEKNCFGHRPPPLSQGLDPALKLADPTNTASLHRQTVGVVSSRKKFVE